MSDLNLINNFIGQKKIILYGASRSGKKFGNVVIREMLERGYQLCLDNGIEVIINECILMFTEPVKSFHRFHRWIWKITGKYPKVSAA